MEEFVLETSLVDRKHLHCISVLFSKGLQTLRFQKLIYLHLLIDCFMKISPQSSEHIHVPPESLNLNFHESVCK